MPQEDVFELTASVSVVLESSEDSFEFVPTQFEPSEEPVEEMPLAELAEGDFWCGAMSYQQILSDPAYQEWLRQEAALQEFVAAPTLAEKLAIAAPFQADGLS